MGRGQWSYHFNVPVALSVCETSPNFAVVGIADRVSYGLMYPWYVMDFCRVRGILCGGSPNAPK